MLTKPSYYISNSLYSLRQHRSLCNRFIRTYCLSLEDKELFSKVLQAIF
uniref:Uncharacterized protein n=1 Tax=Anguilla anguilla TaxID=7936 RepID=A0A0E9PIT9_ANGAN